MTETAWTRPVVYGAIASALLLVVYFMVLTLVSGWAFTRAQFSEFGYFVVTLAVGFGAQVALYTRLRRIAQHGDGSAKVVAVSGGTSTVAMISCCAHYLVNILPVLGATGIIVLVAQYQIELFWVGLAFNVAGLLFVGYRLQQASKHMTKMGQLS